MRNGQALVVSLLLGAHIPGQQASWLRPVARFTVPETRVATADVTADGSLLVIVTPERLVRVFATAPHGRLREFTLPEGADPERARIAVDGATLVVPAITGKPALAVSLADGKPVDPVPALSTEKFQLPAALRNEMPETRDLRVTRDGKRATFCFEGTYWLWSDDALHELNTTTTDARLTGDGQFVVVTQTDGVVVLPATGGEAWSVPDLGFEPVAVPFGNASRFVAIDRTFVVIVDATTKKVESRVPVAKLGFTEGSASVLAARPDGKQLVVRWWSPAQRKPSGWRLDLEAANAQRLPCTPIVAEWVHDGFALLSGMAGPCSSLHFAKWTWLPDNAAAPFDALPSSPANLRSMPDHAGAPIPGRRELLFRCDPGSDPQHLARFDPSNGRVLAKFATTGSPVALGDHVVEAGAGLELRKLEDLAPIAHAPCPEGFQGDPYATAAEHAPRLLLWFLDQFAVYDFVSPADAKAK